MSLSFEAFVLRSPLGLLEMTFSIDVQCRRIPLPIHEPRALLYLWPRQCCFLFAAQYTPWNHPLQSCSQRSDTQKHAVTFTYRKAGQEFAIELSFSYIPLTVTETLGLLLTQHACLGARPPTVALSALQRSPWTTSCHHNTVVRRASHETVAEFKKTATSLLSYVFLTVQNWLAHCSGSPACPGGGLWILAGEPMSKHDVHKPWHVTQRPPYGLFSSLTIPLRQGGTPGCDKRELFVSCPRPRPFSKPGRPTPVLRPVSLS